MLVEVGHGLGVVRRQLGLGDLVDPGAHELAEQLTAGLAADRLRDHADGVLRLNEAQWHGAAHGTGCVGRHNGAVAGRYESWFLSARDTEPGRPPRALWIRHTTHRAAEPSTASGALWCTVFDPAGGAPAAVKQSLPAPPPAGPARFRGEARARGRMAEWELALTGGGPPLRHLRPTALYRLPLPETKLEAPVPDGSASGHVVLDGALVDVVGWRATVGHNWGAEHAERWVWLHAAGFEDEPDTWLELAIARVRVGGALTPWIANGAVAHGGQRFRLGGLGHVAGVRVIARPGRLEAIVPGEPREHPRRRPRRPRPDRRLQYAGVNGTRRSEREVLHAGLADVHLHIRRPGRSSAELAATAGGAYELGGSEFTREVPLQPYPGPLSASTVLSCRERETALAPG